jgi:flavin-dependent dehydrogenase
VRPGIDSDYDVVVMGGGLAGLSLATQIKRARPATSVLVVERNRHPVPEAAFKVGESTSELSAHYFNVVLGLFEHLDREQIRKTGLRFWFSDGVNADFSGRPEVGLGIYLSTRTFQLDRGRLENFLAGHVAGLGCDLAGATRVADVQLGGPRHQVIIRGEQGEFAVSCRWLVDASGRPGILKRQLGLARKIEHDVNSAWFRVDAKVDVDTWADGPFHNGPLPADWRYRSTNHLMGAGYWFWLIALGSGATSLGLVADPDYHPFDAFNTMDKMRAWLAAHEPRAVAEIDRSGGEVLDFRVMKHFAAGCERMFSTDRWCITGDAGPFLDPLYSVGSDFIAIANTYITDFVARDLDGEHRLESRIELANEVFFAFFEIALDIFRGQYGLMQDGAVWTAKGFWDTISYYTEMCSFFFHDKLRDEQFMRDVMPEIRHLQRRNLEAQELFRSWQAANQRRREFASFDEVIGVRDRLAGFEAFVSFTRDLVKAKSDSQIRNELAENLAYLDRLFADMKAEVAQPSTP